MAEDCNDTITITYLPPDAKEYLMSYRNEAIASKVLESRIDKPQLESPLQENEKKKTIRPLENDQTKVFFTMFANNRDFLSIGLSSSDQQIVSRSFQRFFGQIFILNYTSNN